MRLAKVSLIEPRDAQLTFFGDGSLDDDLPLVNSAFWASLIGHIEEEGIEGPRVILDVGCHGGALLAQLNEKFEPAELIGIEPIPALRDAAAERLSGTGAQVRLLPPESWDEIPAGSVDLLVSHEMLYLEPRLAHFMASVGRVLTAEGRAFVVLGCHPDNPLWESWKQRLISQGITAYDHRPLNVMEAASAAGLVADVQPLRRSGWIRYDPLDATFPYPDVQTMLDHHYRHKLIFRLRRSDDGCSPTS